MPIDKSSQLTRAAQHVKKLQDVNFYGELTVKFEHGNIVYMRQVTHMKIDSIEEPTHDRQKRLPR
jgi:hypothetical protein